jgi:hypothetical protein
MTGQPGSCFRNLSRILLAGASDGRRANIYAANLAHGAPIPRMVKNLKRFEKDDLLLELG